jgi:hypothetical protein
VRALGQSFGASTHWVLQRSLHYNSCFLDKSGILKNPRPIFAFFLYDGTAAYLGVDKVPEQKTSLENEKIKHTNKSQMIRNKLRINQKLYVANRLNF